MPRKSSSPGIIMATSSAAFFFASKRPAKWIRRKTSCGRPRANRKNVRAHKPRDHVILSESEESRIQVWTESQRNNERCFALLNMTRVIYQMSYYISAGIWNAGLLTRTSFQSHGLPEKRRHSNSNGLGNLLTRSS